MATRVRTKIHYPTVIRVCADVRHDTAKKAAEKAQSRAQRYAPYRTGTLRDSIVVFERQTLMPDHTTYSVRALAPYWQYVEFGTGPIYARPGGVLVWTENGQTIFAKNTRPHAAVHFMQRAALETTLADFI